MASTPLRPAWRQRFALRKLVWVGPLTIVVAVLVNLVIRTIAVAFFGVPNGFTYLQAPLSLAVPSSFCCWRSSPSSWSVASLALRCASTAC